LAWPSAIRVNRSLSPFEVIRSTLRSTFFFAAHSAQIFFNSSAAPGTQWSHTPKESLPAAWAPRTKGAVSAVAAVVCSIVRRVSNVPSMLPLLLWSFRRPSTRNGALEAVALCSTAPQIHLGPGEAFELGLRVVDRRIDRLPFLSALGDHFAHRALRVHLDPDLGRRRIAGDRYDGVGLWREVVERALGRFRSPPDGKVIQPLELRNVVALARIYQPFDRRA